MAASIRGAIVVTHNKKFDRVVIQLIVAAALIAAPRVARAQFGGGMTVFDPSMFARQLQQLNQETATVTSLAQQLQLMIQNTTGGGAGIWSSNQNLLTNLGELINQQEGLSYTVTNVGQQFQQLYPGFATASTVGVQSPQTSVDTTLNTLNGALASAQAQANNFAAEQTSLQNLELKNQTAVGNLQAVQTSNEIALAEVQQIQLLRQLVMAQMNSQNVASASQVNNQAQSSLASVAFFSAAASPNTPDSFHNAASPPQP
jgi:P-type conjugative transfer protein TrbJ